MSRSKGTRRAAPPVPPEPQKFISLSAELEELGAAVAGARVAIDSLRFSTFAEWDENTDLREVPGGVSATLTLLGQRVRLVRRVLNKERPASELATHYNVVDAETVAGLHDVLIPIEPSK